jgi:glutamyl-Q tRNA(Asp) synthetase
MSNFPPVRFAPSPTGFLHIGHAYSAWFTASHATDSPVSFILRIENIDQTRCRPEYETAIYEDLTWLGFSWPAPVRRQSEHFSDYQAALAQLESRGLLYPCFCTRKEIAEEISRSPSAPHGPEGYLYPGTCRHLSNSQRSKKAADEGAYAIRLNMDEALRQTNPLRWHDRTKGWQDATPHILGDVVLARKDTPASYHLCVTWDDAFQQIGLVTRGEDLFHATHLHRLLQELLSLPTPDYHHHPLLLDSDGNRFAKRNKGVTLRDLRKRGFSPEQIRSNIAEQKLHELLQIP